MWDNSTLSQNSPLPGTAYKGDWDAAQPRPAPSENPSQTSSTGKPSQTPRPPKAQLGSLPYYNIHEFHWAPELKQLELLLEGRAPLYLPWLTCLPLVEGQLSHLCHI